MKTSGKAPIFTILTPTYNRAHTLTMVYDCLKRQTCQDFEWLIVDDGSTDSTEYLIRSWLPDSPLTIRYLKQANGGKHTALNRGIQEARGEFTTILDSDDALMDNGLALFLQAWHSIPEAERSHYCGVAGLCQDENGRILGDNFPTDPLDSDAVEITYTHRLGDDRHGMNLTSVLQQFPFPVFQGERFLTESVVWNRLALHYKIRYTNKVVCIKEYRKDGLTRSYLKLATHNPEGMTLYYQELAALKRPLPLTSRAWFHACYVRYALHGRMALKAIAAAAPSKVWLVPALVVGRLLYERDVTTLRTLGQATPQPTLRKAPTIIDEVE